MYRFATIQNVTDDDDTTDNMSWHRLDLTKYGRSKSARITWPLTLTLSTSWTQVHLETILCKFGLDPAICVREETICAKVYRRTDRRRTPRYCISSFLEWLEWAKNGNFQRHSSHLMPPIQRTPTNIGITLIFSQTRVSALHFRSWWYGSIFIKIIVMDSERQLHNVTEWIIALQGHPRSLILVPIESACTYSYSSGQ